MGLIDLFLELAQPNEKGESRWVKTSEFIGKYKPLELGNGWSWGRASSPLQRTYNVDVDRSITPGNRIDAIRLTGFNDAPHFNQTIRKDICDEIRKRKCVMLGVNGTSENTKIEVDHKDGRKNDMRISNQSTQKLEDFQPLCKAANDIKRQICKNCKATDKRWDARNIEGNPYSFYEGDENYNEEQGCVGCYQYDPVEYRIRSVQKVSQESIDTVMSKLYPNYKTKSDKQ
ncbi:MAG: restriction endonuclease [Bacteroidales bacterium]|nr:restriction endonuclease [Bacteroidales bacterium]